MSSASRLAVIVPTLGLSPWLRPCLEALRGEATDLEIVLVDQGAEPSELASGLVDRRLRVMRNLGFAAANNLALAELETPFVATVNDDVIVERGWSQALLDELVLHPEVAAVQGAQLELQGSAGELGSRVDGAGLAWNASWQAVQLGRHQDIASFATHAPREIFGVSATAAIYRRAALEEARLADGQIFDSRLQSYYEDVDLACRLRAAGHGARLVLAARAGHAGSATGRQLPLACAHLIYANRYLVLARLLGRSFWLLLPRLWLRDLIDLWQAWRHGDGSLTRAIPLAWWRAARLLRDFARPGRAALPLTELRRFRPV